MSRYTPRAFCFKDTEMDDLEEGKISTICLIPKEMIVSVA